MANIENQITKQRLINVGVTAGTVIKLCNFIRSPKDKLLIMTGVFEIKSNISISFNLWSENICRQVRPNLDVNLVYFMKQPSL